MHTGSACSAELLPASPGEGICFMRNGTRIPAIAENVVNTRRCTCIGVGDTRIDTVEHLLSALYGMGVDNALVTVDGPELPILDGSALPWAQAVLQSGIVDTGVHKETIILREPLVISLGDAWLVASPSNTFSITCISQFDHPLLGLQAYTYVADSARYVTDVAPARTFGFAAEVEALLKAGLALGGSLDNALIVYDDHFSSELRVDNECLRHKALDLIGDLALVGDRFCAAITAIKSGHAANTALAAKIRQSI